jgi:ribonuclease VapC
MVLDTSAIVTIILREPRYHRLAACVDGALIRVIGAQSLFESAMVLSSRLGLDARPLLADFNAARRIEVIPFTEEHYRVATDGFLR